MEYIGRSGNRYAIVNTVFEEACIFNSFGEMVKLVSPSFVYSSGFILRPVNIVSVAGESCKGVCEVYYKGKVCVVNRGYVEAISCIRDSVPLDELVIYRVSHPKGAKQVMLAVKPSVTFNMISRAIGSSNWEDIK